MAVFHLTKKRLVAPVCIKLYNMKKRYIFSFFIAMVVFFSACTKTVEVPVQNYVDPLVGSWYLYDASESYGNGWYRFDAGIDGVISFYSNGTAQYDDGYDFMQGSWYMADASTGYYDQFGNYYSDPHQTFQTSLKGSNGTSLTLYFDDFSFAGNNEFIGTYYNGKSIERYTFKRN